MNKVILIGNLGADPEIKTLADGGRVANLRVATNKSWKDPTTGERKEKTEWHRVTVWDQGSIKYLEVAAKKGTRVSIIGELTTRKYTGNDGVEKSSTEVTINRDGTINIEAGGVERETQEDRPRTSTRSRKPAPPREAAHDLDDEIPF